MTKANDRIAKTEPIVIPIKSAIDNQTYSLNSSADTFDESKFIAHIININDDKFKEYSEKQNTNSRNNILKSYDLLLNDKYNVVLNQKTIERVKNFFQ